MITYNEEEDKEDKEEDGEEDEKKKRIIVIEYVVLFSDENEEKRNKNEANEKAHFRSGEEGDGISEIEFEIELSENEENGTESFKIETHSTVRESGEDLRVRKWEENDPSGEGGKGENGEFCEQKNERNVDEFRYRVFVQVRDDDFDLLFEFVRDESREKPRGKERFESTRGVRFGRVFIGEV